MRKIYHCLFHVAVNIIYFHNICQLSFLQKKKYVTFGRFCQFSYFIVFRLTLEHFFKAWYPNDCRIYKFRDPKVLTRIFIIFFFFKNPLNFQKKHDNWGKNHLSITVGYNLFLLTRKKIAIQLCLH